MRALIDEWRALDVSRPALRRFGLAVGGVLLGVAAVVLWRRGYTATPLVWGLGGAGGALVVLGAVAPGLLRPLYRVWMGLALVLGFVMTHVILAVLFYAVVTPIGLVMRAFGHDPLQRRRDPAAPTYWQPKTYDDPSPRRLEKYY